MTRTVRALLLCLAVSSLNTTLAFRPVLAQQSSVTPHEVGQIVDAILGAVLRPTDSLSRVSVAKRKIVLDLDRTLAAFGYKDAASVTQTVNVRRSVLHGDKSVLDDCDFVGRQRCASLGWKAYVWLEPVSIAGSTALVRLHAAWPDRGRARFATGSTPTATASLVGFMIEARLSRATGTWKFVERTLAVAH
jgi:hypothetical protein